MPTICKWKEMPEAVRNHLSQRMLERRISLQDLNVLRLWMESSPLTPDGDWYKDFGSFKLCGNGPYPKTFLTADQKAHGVQI
jgi:hypothetical protein